MCGEKQGATAARRQQHASLGLGLWQQPSAGRNVTPASVFPSLCPPPLLSRTPLGFSSWWKWLAMARTGKSTRFVAEFRSSLAGAGLPGAARGSLTEALALALSLPVTSLSALRLLLLKKGLERLAGHAPEAMEQPWLPPEKGPSQAAAVRAWPSPRNSSSGLSEIARGALTGSCCCCCCGSKQRHRPSLRLSPGSLAGKPSEH